MGKAVSAFGRSLQFIPMPGSLLLSLSSFPAHPKHSTLERHDSVEAWQQSGQIISTSPDITRPHLEWWFGLKQSQIVLFSGSESMANYAMGLGLPSFKAAVFSLGYIHSILCRRCRSWGTLRILGPPSLQKEKHPKKGFRNPRGL